MHNNIIDISSFQNGDDFDEAFLLLTIRMVGLRDKQNTYLYLQKMYR